MGTREFDNILNDCIERMLDRRESLEECLARYPEQAAELGPLLETAIKVRKVTEISPNPFFLARARYEIRTAVVQQPRRRFFWPQWATAVTAVMVLLLGSGGTVAAASSAMPDDFLYPVKLATEQVQLTFTTSDVGKAELYARIADRRIAEIAAMAASGNQAMVTRTAARLGADLQMVATLAGVVVSASENGLLGATAAPPAPTDKSRASQSGTAAGEWAELQANLELNAIYNPAILRQLLETAPQQVKPALEEAIAIAESGYQQALDAVSGK